MSEEFVQARVAKVNLRLPIYRDKQTTLAIAEEVSARVAAMEEQAGRIDSQAFALQAAFAYAAELHAEKADRDADTRDLLKVLDRIASQLARILKG